MVRILSKLTFRCVKITLDHIYQAIEYVSTHETFQYLCVADAVLVLIAVSVNLVLEGFDATVVTVACLYFAFVGSCVVSSQWTDKVL